MEAVTGSGGGRLEAVCFEIRDKALDLYFDAKYIEASDVVRAFIEQWEQLLPVHEKVLLFAMHARCEAEAGRIELAVESMKQAQEELFRAPNAEYQCILDNVAGVLAYKRGDAADGLSHLQHAAGSAALAGDDCKLLTVTNIAVLLEEKNKRQSRVFHRMAHQLCSALHYHDFRASVLESASSR